MNQPYLESGEKSQSYIVTIHNKPVEHYERSLDISNFQVHLKYLFIDTNNAAPIQLGYN